MPYYVVTNGDNYTKVFDSGELLVGGISLPYNQGELFTPHVDFMLPYPSTLILVNDDLTHYRALIGAAIGMPYPVEDPAWSGDDYVWFQHVLGFDDQQSGTDLDDFDGVRDAIQEFVHNKSK